MSDPRNRQYSNGDITVFWIPSKCIHATTCFRELIDVFNPGRRPWVNMDGAPSRKIIEVVNKCPTQALVWKYDKDLSEEEKMNQYKGKDAEITPRTINQGVNTAAGKPTNVKIMKDGPVVLEGNFKLIGGDMQELKPSVMTSICRCGASNSMPYCDGAHRKIGFSDE